MGHWEWQRGEFKLPSAGFTQMRTAVAETDKQHKELLFAETQRFWGGLTAKQKRDNNEFRAAIEAFRVASGINDSEIHEFLYVRSDAKPRRVMKADMEFPTNRTLTFGGRGFAITFDRDSSTVEFGISESKSAVERAHQHPVMQAFDRQLEQMRWTRGTGGRTYGDDEYAADARQEHGYDSELTQTGYGPVGAANWPLRTRQWKDPKGDTYHVEYKWSTRGGGGAGQGRVKKGAPASTGGQFAGRYRSDSDVSLRW